METDRVIIGQRSGKTQDMIAELKERYPRKSEEEIIRKLKTGEPF